MPEKNTGTKKSNSSLVIIVIVVLVLIGLIFAGRAVSKFLAKKFVTGALQGVINSQTGVKTNLQDLEKGKLTFTDTKTGTKVDVGSGKIPDNFPKDFPIYPGSKVTASMSGADKGQANGFWVTLTTTDSLDKVTSYYKTQLALNKWETTATYSTGDTTSETVTKPGWSGTVAISNTNSNKETDIVIYLTAEETPAP